MLPDPLSAPNHFCVCLLLLLLLLLLLFNPGFTCSNLLTVFQVEMPRNVEIKARVRAAEPLVENAKRLSCSEGTLILQEDVFFNVPEGRLKLRDLKDGSGQLIFYQRPDLGGPKLSDYSISPTADPQGLKKVLIAALGVNGKVTKERQLFLIGQTRVHVDEVSGLGSFVELEVVMNDDQSEEEGAAIAERLMVELGIHREDLLTGAYVDMILADK
uniref:Si:ch211-156b7.4 n=1 Tax=Callorhinchus milii TaxID=7868 RepID=A0A4W3GI72_CALMI